MSSTPDTDNKDSEEDGDDISQPYDVFEYRVPSWALSYLFNGDSSGIEDTDLIAIDNFVKREKLNLEKGNWHYDSENNESFFSHHNDVHGLGDDCVDIEWLQWLDR